MTLAERLLAGFAIAGALAYMTTPYAIAVAERLQLFDKPLGYKGHQRPTPYLGGAVVVLGFAVALLLTAGDWERSAPLLGGGAALWVLGTLDDRRNVPAGLRVLLELALATVAWSSGLGWHLHAGGLVDLTFTCVWVVAVVNAFNLFDNMDGAASTMALVVAAGAALIGIVHDDVWLAVAAASLCGACLGFLPRNISVPAKIFLGDGGSMPVGFAVSVLVMVAASTSTAAWRAPLVALLLVAIPALDTSLVIVSRRRRGVSILSGGRDHLTHRSRRFLPSARAVALWLGAIQAGISVLAVLISRGGSSLVVVTASAYLLAAGAVIAVLDTQEIEEFGVAGPSSGRLLLGKRALVSLVVLGLGAGMSPFWFSYFDQSVWVPIGLGITLLCGIAVVIRPTLPGGPGALALGGVLGLGMWSLASTAWAESVENAVVSGNRWLVYGALLAVFLVLVSHDRRAATLLAAAGFGVLLVAGYVLVRLLGSDPGSLFLGGRLNDPLGYINGEGCLFAMGIWPCVAAAESRRWLIAGPAAAAATLMGCLAVLSQSRGTALAIVGSLALVLALAPGRRRRAWALLVIAGAVAAAGPALLHVYDAGAGGPLTPSIGHAAARATLLAALAAGCVWALAVGAWEPAVTRGERAGPLRAAASWLLVVPALVALVLGAASAGRIEHDVSRQWHAFTSLSEPGEAGPPSSSAAHSRLLSGGGNRYDYWRVAWKVWREHPAIGVGAGNYRRFYYQLRSTGEDIQQPHSLELQVLCELGVIGLLALASFLAGVGWGAARMRHDARRSPLARALMVSGVGIFSAWLVQTSVDWMHLLPGLTALALAAAATLLWPRPHARRHARSALARRAMASRRPALAAAGATVAATLVVAGASLSRQGLAEHFRSRAQDELARSPGAALSDAEQSLEFDADSTASLYLKAAALARFDQGAAVRATLRRALAREPQNFVTWALLGDVELREGHAAMAHRDYVHAARLNPRDAALRAQALRGPGSSTAG